MTQYLDNGIQNNHVTDVSTKTVNDSKTRPNQSQNQQQLGYSLGQSVVPDLMRVYESLTQSSTPQQPQNENTRTNITSNLQSSQPNNFINSSHDQQHIATIQKNFQHDEQQGTRQISHETHFHSQEHLQQPSQPPQHYSQPITQQQHTQPQHIQTHITNPKYNTVNHFSHHTPSEPDYPTIPSNSQQYFHSKETFTTNTSRSFHPSPSNQNLQVSHQKQNQTSTKYNDSSATSKTSRSKRPLENDNTKSSIMGNVAGQPSTKSRKKGVGDQRWSKRFTWPDTLHREFVSAIFDVGLKHASPSAILENMTPNEQITSERIKSHLQKYRLHKSKSKREFMDSYDAALTKFKTNGLTGTTQKPVLKQQQLSMGEEAAQITYTALSSESNTSPYSFIPVGAPSQTNEISLNIQQGALRLPQLSQEEKNSPLGTSMGYLLGLFISLIQQLNIQRGINPDTNRTIIDGVPMNATHKTNEPNHVHNNSMRGSYMGHTDSNPNLLDKTNHKVWNIPKPHQQQQQSDISIKQENAPYGNNQTMHQQIGSEKRSQETNINYNSNDWKPNTMNSFHQPNLPTQSQNQQKDEESSHSQQQSWQVSNPIKNNLKDVRTEIGPSGRNFPSMEESNKIKREMQSQMALQKNFRAMKEQELSKCRNQAVHPIGSGTNQNRSISQNEISGNTNSDSRVPKSGYKPNINVSAASDERSHNMQVTKNEHIEDGSVKKASPSWEGGGHNTEDFWNVDMMNDQLFEFLMEE